MHTPVITTHVILRLFHLRVGVSANISNISPDGSNEFLTSCFAIIVDELPENPGWVLDSTAGVKLVMNKSYEGKMWLHAFFGFVASGRPVNTGQEQLFGKNKRRDTQIWSSVYEDSVQSNPTSDKRRFITSFQIITSTPWLLSELAEEHQQ